MQKCIPAWNMSRCKNNGNLAEGANVSTVDKKGLAAEIMEKLLEMYYNN